MSGYPKRSLRNTNSCPIVENSVYLKLNNLDHRHLLPTQVSRMLTTTQNISCPQIYGLSTLQFKGNIQTCLQAMSTAVQWQKSSLIPQQNGNSKNSKQKSPSIDQKIIINNHTPIQKPKQTTNIGFQNQIFSVLFQNELQEFIMNPPTLPNYDLDFQLLASPRQNYSQNQVNFNFASFDL